MSKILSSKQINYRLKKLTETGLPQVIIDELRDELKGKEVTERQLQEIIKEVVKSYDFAQIDPGSAVGTVAAQSIGEPGTQMSLPGNETVIVQNEGKIQFRAIGEFVENILEKYDSLLYDNELKSIVCDIPTNANIFVPGIDKEGNLEWQKLLQVSKHLPNGNLLKITTESGREIVATFAHSFVTKKDDEIVPIAGKDLKIGDSIPVVYNLPTITTIEFVPTVTKHTSDHNEAIMKIANSGDIVNLSEADYSNNGIEDNKFTSPIKLDENLGWLLGAYLANGEREGTTIKIQTYTNDYKNRVINVLRGLNAIDDLSVEEKGTTLTEVLINSEILSEIITSITTSDYNLVISGWILNSPENFVKALLRGLLDSNIKINRENGKIIISLDSESLSDSICLLLSRFGIFTLKSRTEDNYKITIPSNFVRRYLDTIGSDTQIVDTAMNTVLKRLHDSDIDKIDDNFKVQADIVWDKIVKLDTITSPTHYVYDFSVSQLETFMTTQGLITHNTLQTFHYSGVAEMSVLRGLPRLIEIVDARKNPTTPTMKIYLDKLGEKDETIAKQVARRIELTTINNVAKGINHNYSEGCIKIKLEPVLLEDKGVDVETIVRRIQKKKRRIKAEIDPDDEYTIIVTPIKEVKFNELPRLAEKVKDIPIKGLKNITRVVTMKKDDKYYLQSEGSNFSELLRVPGVDPTRCYTTDINQIAETLGIEAARNALIKESLAVMKEQGLDVDKRHVMLVADLMTLSGEVQQIGRHGVSGKKSSVFARASFEVTVKHLLEAAIHGEHEPLKGITENVIVGQNISLGTGIVDLSMSPNYREFVDKKITKETAEE